MAEASSQQIDFYQLNGTTQSAFDEALPKILNKALSAGHTIAIVTPSQDIAMRLDERLWTNIPTSFLPHHVHIEKSEQENAPQGQNQVACSSPVTIFTQNQQNAALNSSASIILSLSGSIKQHKTPQNATRILDMFTTQDAQTQAARQRWKDAKTQGFALNYYAQTDQGWQKKS